MKARSTVFGSVAIVMIVLSANGVQLAGQSSNIKKPGEARLLPPVQKRGKQPPSPTDGIKELLRGKTVKTGDNVAYTGKTGFKLIARVDERGEVVGWSVADQGGRTVVSVNAIGKKKTGKTPAECRADFDSCRLHCSLEPAPTHDVFSKEFWRAVFDHWGEDPMDCFNSCTVNYSLCLFLSGLP